MNDYDFFFFYDFRTSAGAIIIERVPRLVGICRRIITTTRYDKYDQSDSGFSLRIFTRFILSSGYRHSKIRDFQNNHYS